MRLNTRNRAEIVKKMIRHRFTKEYHALLKDHAALVAKFYEDIYPSTMMARMIALPDGWLPESSSFSVRISGSEETLHFNGELGQYKYNFKELVSVPTKHKRMLAKHHKNGYHSFIAVYDGNHPLSAEFMDMENRFIALDDKIGEARVRLQSILGAIYNTEKLVEVWPETEPFLDGMETIKKVLPAIPLEQLNTMFELPVS